jgi:hypothetical protein
LKVVDIRARRDFLWISQSDGMKQMLMRNPRVENLDEAARWRVLNEIAREERSVFRKTLARRLLLALCGAIGVAMLLWLFAVVE